MIRAALALVVSSVLVYLFGGKVLQWLKKLHFGQTIYDLGPEAHQKKQGTPIMGGLMFVGSTVLCTLAFHPVTWQGIWDFPAALLLIALLSMAVGFADDYTKAVKKRSMGLSAWQKIAGQVISAALFAVYCYFNPQVGSAVKIPFTALEWDLGIFYLPLMTLLVIFMVNSANLLDGEDGLLATCTSVGTVGWAALAMIAVFTCGDAMLAGNYYGMAIFALALMGGAAAYLKYNHHPAQVFMGDTGSMFIGGATVGMAMLLRQPFLLLLIAFPMIISSVSVILQRYYFKLTHGKRIFKMSPLHHHFELSGYPETWIVSMYGIVTAILTITAVLSAVQGIL